MASGIILKPSNSSLPLFSVAGGVSGSVTVNDGSYADFSGTMTTLQNYTCIGISAIYFSGGICINDLYLSGNTLHCQLRNISGQGKKNLSYTIRGLYVRNY